jgi:transposase
VISVAPGTKVYLACRPVSMRYGFDGLAAQVKQVLHADPFSGHLFLFRSKRAGRTTFYLPPVKALVAACLHLFDKLQISWGAAA